MSPGDLRRLQAARAQAAGVRDFYTLEAMVMEAELARKLEAALAADETFRDLDAKIRAETEPQLPQINAIGI